MENFDYQKAYELLEHMTFCALQVRAKHIIITELTKDLRDNPSMEDIIIKAAEAEPYYRNWKATKQRYDSLRKEFKPFINDDNGRTIEYLDLLIFEYGENL